MTVLLCVGVVVLAVVVAQVQHPAAGRRGGLVLGGAVGNLSERIAGGHGGQVPDFITLEHWPTFNLADACVTVGVIVVIVALLFGGRSASGPSRRSSGRRERGTSRRAPEPAEVGETISTEVPALLAGVRVDRGVAMVADVSRGRRPS